MPGREPSSKHFIRQDLQDLQDLYVSASRTKAATLQRLPAQKAAGSTCREAAEFFPAIFRIAGNILSILLILSDTSFTSILWQCERRPPSVLVHGPVDTRARKP